ncbi:MAG: riboflavin synthase [Bacillaceae bacterium]|nr:riboflavin synthase [Bacillaceae bacterium]
MFTGIIEEIGHISSVRRGSEWIQLYIEGKKVLEGVRTGDSIAVNGICLTVTSFTEKGFSVDVMPETLKKTSLSRIQPGSPVNLERALAAGDRFGGHFVTGHVDGTGRVKRRAPLGNAIVFEIEADETLTRQMIPGGSVAVDGISLTIVSVDREGFSVSIIPHTLSETVLQYRQPGDIVNLETDVIGKYIERYMERRFADSQSNDKSQITESFLRENGFL